MHIYITLGVSVSVQLSRTDQAVNVKSSFCVCILNVQTNTDKLTVHQK